MKSKKIFLHNILLPKNGNYKYPLLSKGLSKKDLDQGIKVLRTGNITMNKHTFSFVLSNLWITTFDVVI